MTQVYPFIFKRFRADGLFGNLWRGDAGASLAEFALLVPFLLSLTVGIIEMSNVFYTRSVLNEMVRDATRRFAVGALDKAATEELVLHELAQKTDTAGNVQVTETEVEGDNVDVTVTLSVPLKGLLLFDSLSSSLVNFGAAKPDLTFSATMMKY